MSEGLTRREMLKFLVAAAGVAGLDSMGLPEAWAEEDIDQRLISRTVQIRIDPSEQIFIGAKRGESLPLTPIPGSDFVPPQSVTTLRLLELRAEINGYGQERTGIVQWPAGDYVLEVNLEHPSVKGEIAPSIMDVNVPAMVKGWYDYPYPDMPEVLYKCYGVPHLLRNEREYSSNPNNPSNPNTEQLKGQKYAIARWDCVGKSIVAKERARNEGIDLRTAYEQSESPWPILDASLESAYEQDLGFISAAINTRLDAETGKLIVGAYAGVERAKRNDKVLLPRQLVQSTADWLMEDPNQPWEKDVYTVLKTARFTIDNNPNTRKTDELERSILKNLEVGTEIILICSDPLSLDRNQKIITYLRGPKSQVEVAQFSYN